jgi:hypothetical protein
MIIPAVSLSGYLSLDTRNGFAMAKALRTNATSICAVVDIPGTFWEQSATDQGILRNGRRGPFSPYTTLYGLLVFREHSGNVHRTLREH